MCQVREDMTHIEDSDLHWDDGPDLVLGRGIVGFAELHDVHSLHGRKAVFQGTSWLWSSILRARASCDCHVQAHIFTGFHVSWTSDGRVLPGQHLALMDGKKR